MYDELKNKKIDRSKKAFKDFPKSLNGEIYIRGDAKKGWVTRPDETPKQTLTKMKQKRKAELREEFINDALSTKYAEIDAAQDEAAVKAVKLKG